MHRHHIVKFQDIKDSDLKVISDCEIKQENWKAENCNTYSSEGEMRTETTIDPEV